MSTVGFVAAIPNPVTVEPIAVWDPETRTIIPAAGHQKRANPVSEGGTIWRDNHGVARAIMVMQLSENILQAFDNSGVNLAKAILSELTQYGRENGFTNIVRRNTWDAEFDASEIVKKGVSYMTLALTSRGSVGGVTDASNLFQSWLEQGGKYFTVKQVDNALAHISKRSDVPLETELEARAGFCSNAIWGFWNSVILRKTKNVGTTVSC